MSKVDNFISALKNNCREWTCSLHTTGSNQPAAIFREVKKLGYKFEEVSPNRWAKSMYCTVCKQNTTHYKLLEKEPVFNEKKRLLISKDTRAKILRIFDNKDAFTGASISSVAEIDHKIPWTRLDEDVNANIMNEEDIKNNFQLLTREHNLLKDRMCGFCKNECKRPPFLGISFWYDGDENYRGTCYGCGWYDGERWRKVVDNLLKDNI